MVGLTACSVPVTSCVKLATQAWQAYLRTEHVPSLGRPNLNRKPLMLIIVHVIKMAALQ